MKKIADTAFILGAGFSHASGIPLLSGFVERMWQYAIRRKAGANSLSTVDLETFDLAMKIREELDSYHGRAMFDDRNIEDILSILSFNALAGLKKEKDKLAAMTRAIARTIDLSCTVKHPGVIPGQARPINDGPDVYREFWGSLFAANRNGKRLPAIITFNYDLVLERSLLQTLVGTHFGEDNELPFQDLHLRYHYAHQPGVQYRVSYTPYRNHSIRSPERLTSGTILREVPADLSSNATQIDILKLHGSLNFPKNRARATTNNRQNVNLTDPELDPFILPPVFNKLAGDGPTPMWQAALEQLRQVKNIVVVGYSLPQTDTYMQYFLKAALGPNLNLNKIMVFDPALFTESEAERSMRTRYEACFAPQLRGRIEFRPPNLAGGSRIYRPGTTEHFVHTLTDMPDDILF